MLDLIKKIRPVLYIAIAALSYLTGYLDAQVKGDLEIERLKAENAASVINAQKQVKETYEKRISQLSTSLEHVRNDNSRRLRELDDFDNTRTSLAACRRDRRDLGRLAVRGEELLRRADSYLEALSR